METIKKEKLELKHLAPYLPYGLHGSIITKKSSFEVELITLTKYTAQTRPSIHGYTYCSFEDFKPILRPLSYLAKDQETYDLIWDKCKDTDENLDYICEFQGDLTETSLSFRCVQILFAKHYDVFGLIEKGLAIDINTINQPE